MTDISNNEYYVTIKGKLFGPFPKQNIIEMIGKGTIGKETKISQDGIDWRRAGDLPEFFPETVDPTLKDRYKQEEEETTLEFSSGISSDDPCIWYVSRDGRTKSGPFTTQTVAEGIWRKQLNATCYIWRHGEQARTIKQEPTFAPYLVRTREKYLFWTSAASNVYTKKFFKLHCFYLLESIGLSVLLLIAFLFFLMGFEFQIEFFMLTSLFFAVLAFAAYIANVVMSMILLYKQWGIIQPYSPTTSPQKAVGFLFIPIFNIYWIFVAYCSLASDMNKILAEFGSKVRANSALAVAYCVLMILGAGAIGVCAVLPFLNISFKEAAIEIDNLK